MSNTRLVHFKQKAGIGYEARRLVRTVEFDYGDSGRDEPRATRGDAVTRLMEFLTKGSLDPRRLGIRVLLLAHILGRLPDACKRQKDLAARLGVSEARVSAAVKSLRAEITRLSKRL